MNPELRDRLVRLRQGELAPDEARILEDEIAADPAVAGAHREVEVLLAALESLPDPTPPLALQHRVAARFAPRRRRWPIAVALLAAAAVAVLVLRPRPERLLVDGSALVDGHAEVRALGGLVEVDGLVRVESASPEGVIMNARNARDWMVGATVGALLTVTVYEGTARVYAADSDVPVDLVAPDVRTFGDPPPPLTPVPSPPERPLVAPSDELETLRAENAVLRGQLDMLGANEVPFSEVPGFEPDAVAAIVAEAYPDTPSELDCSEFPCIVKLTMSGDTSQIGQAMRSNEVSTALVELGKPSLPAGAEMGSWAYTNIDPEGRPVLLIAWYPDSVEARIGARLEDRLDAASEAAARGE